VSVACKCSSYVEVDSLSSIYVQDSFNFKWMFRNISVVVDTRRIYFTKCFVFSFHFQKSFQNIVYLKLVKNSFLSGCGRTCNVLS